MLTTLQTRKLTRAFHLFDLDQNGMMDRQDCELVIRATTQAMGHAPGSPEYTAYHDEYMAGWAVIVALGDSDGDQKLTATEFCTAYGKLMEQPAQFDAVVLGRRRLSPARPRPGWLFEPGRTLPEFERILLHRRSQCARQLVFWAVLIR